MSDILSTPTEGWLYQAGQITPTAESLAVERPLDIRLNEESLAITLCSPGADRSLALGLLFSEGRVDSAQEVLAWSRSESEGSEWTGPIACENATVGPSSLAGEPAPTNAKVTRVLTMNSACGLCGKTEWEKAPSPPLPANRRRARLLWGIADLPRFFAAMQAAQNAFARTGACHAAAAFGADGQMICLQEDVGRHNAVDKVLGELLARNRIGAAASADDAAWPALLCVSGRVAYEIVAKAHRGGFAALAAVGAPSSLSVRHAQAWDLALLGFCREGRATAYAHREKLASTSLLFSQDSHLR